MLETNLLKEGEVFFKQWLRSPKSMGSILPSSKFLARGMAAQVEWREGEFVIELGGGTGAITQGLIERGIPRDKIIVIELDTYLFDYMRGHFPGVRVVQGDATRLDEIIGRMDVGKIGTVISGLPMVNMPEDFQRAILSQSFAALMDPSRAMLQYTYSPLSPLPYAKFGAAAKMAKLVMLNVPPAFIWRYTPA